MRSKQKVLIISIAVVLALAIIGLTIGLVLVLTRTQTNSFVSLSYVAKEVDCTITANGKLIDAELGDENKEETTIFLNNGKEVDSVSHRSGNSAGEYTFDFDNVQLPAGGWAEYHFNIQDDTALDQAKASRPLGVKFEVVGDHDYSNIHVIVETFKDGASVYESVDKVLFATLTAPNEKTTEGKPSCEFVVKVMVTDPMQDVNEFSMSLVMDIAYGITDEVVTWGEDTSSMTTFKTQLATAHETLWSNSFNYLSDEPVVEIDSPEKLQALGEYINDYTITSDGVYRNYAFARLVVGNYSVENGYGGTEYMKYVNFKLTKDLDLAGRGWTPIGYGAGIKADADNKSFSGIFDGNGHTIYNLYIDKDGEDFGGKGGASQGIGLFGHVEAGRIQNLNVSGAIVRGNNYVGGIVGYMYGLSDYTTDSGMASQIINCTMNNASINSIYNNEEEDGTKAGAIVGIMTISSIDGCSVTNSHMFADRDAGIMVGCLNTGWVFGDNNTADKDTCSVECNYTSRGTGNESAHGNIRNELVGRGA